MIFSSECTRNHFLTQLGCLRHSSDLLAGFVRGPPGQGMDTKINETKGKGEKEGVERGREGRDKVPYQHFFPTFSPG